MAKDEWTVVPAAVEFDTSAPGGEFSTDVFKAPITGFFTFEASIFRDGAVTRYSLGPVEAPIDDPWRVVSEKGFPGL